MLNCIPIFKHLSKIEYLNIIFSDYIIYDDVNYFNFTDHQDFSKYNLNCFKKIKYLNINKIVPGFELELYDHIDTCKVEYYQNVSDCYIAL